MEDRAFISFYKQHDFVPNQVPEHHRALHFRRRDALYRQLGIVSGLLKGRDVIEFGPGSGDNSVHTASFGLGSLVLVDGHDVSIAELRRKAGDGRFPADCDIYESDVLAFTDARRFDLVIAEGLIHDRSDTKPFCRHMAEFARPGGIVVITTIDPVSSFADICRRLFKPIYMARDKDFDTCMKSLAALFKPDLDALPGFARTHYDWVLDNIFHPLPLDRFFPFPDAVAALTDDFDVYASHPHFFSDWRWWKAIAGSEAYNERALAQYRRWLPLLIDSRADPEVVAQPRCDGALLETLCREAYKLHLAAWDADDPGLIPPILIKIEEIVALLRPALPETASSFADLVASLRAALAGRTPDFGRFLGLFGRGQQYVSFIRRSAPPYSPPPGP
ncbi:MAG TPA: class I SAM-dependent methyltransferase [Stellaceae bacterium]|nr:class I SAM-dependent methyltransferase [Stellaceae bacterium]